MPKLALNASKKTKHTPAGEIPVDWGWAPARNICKRICVGIVIAPSQYYTESETGVLAFRSANVREGKVNDSNWVRLSRVGHERNLKSEVLTNDVLIVRTGAPGVACVVPPKFSGTNCIDLVISSPDPKFVNSEFFCSFINSDVGRREVVSKQGGLAQKHLNVGAFAKIPIPLPPLPEQRRIAQILSIWDRAIETLESLIAAKERRKQALMQQLLMRTSEFDKVGHSRHRLGDVVERITRKNPSGDTNVLTISAQQGLISQSSYFNRNVAGEDLSTYYQLKRGEFAYNRSSSKGFPFGAIKRLNAYPTGVVSTLYLCFRITDEKRTCSDFLCHCFDSGMLNQGLRCVAQEGARAHGLLNVTATDFMDLDVCLPDFASQQRIATILNTADRELNLHRQHLESLRAQKRGLMQKLLTGEVRTRQ